MLLRVYKEKLCVNTVHTQSNEFTLCYIIACNDTIIARRTKFPCEPICLLAHNVCTCIIMECKAKVVA